ncbi:MAG: MFS transporter [Lachnospiraceae bacterium]|nr:MFS transporter [Lachnospiraceae bacterium]
MGENKVTENRPEEKQVTYRDILRELEYRKLIFSSVINRFGDSVDAIALTWLVYQITHNAMWSAIVFGLNTLPNVVVQPFAGAIVERMNKKRVVVFTHFLRAVVISGFAALYNFGIMNAGIMAVTTLIITTIESFNLPADSAFTVEVVRKEHMTAGMSMSKMLSGAATLVGTGFAGVLIAAAGIIPAMLIDVATFVIAGCMTWSMKYHMDRPGAAADAEAFGSTVEEEIDSAVASPDSTDAQGFREMFLDGIRYVAQTPAIRNFCLLCVALNFMLVPINALQAPIAEEIFGMGSELLSVAGVFASVGGILGAALLPAFSRRFSTLQITCLCVGMLGACLAAITLGRFLGGAAIPAYLLAGGMFLLLMISASILGGVLGIQFMKSVDGEYMARASAVFNASATASMPVGSFLVSLAVAQVSTSGILLISAALAGIVLLVTALKRPELEKKEELANAA